MLFFILFGFMSIIGFILFYVRSYYNFSTFFFEGLGLALSALCVASLGACVVTLSVFRVDQNASIEAYKIRKEAIADNRKENNSNSVEKQEDAYCVTRLIIDTNSELAEYKYYNDSLWFDWFIVDEFANLDYLK